MSARGPVRAGAALAHGLARALRPAWLAWMRRRGPLPRRVRVGGLGAPVRVRLDEDGVPHIRARSDADAFCAQGYCHGLWRFFQMDMLRRVLRGRLAEVVGDRPLGPLALPPFAGRSTTADADRLMRALGLLEAARRVWDGASAEGRALLGAYVAGVNSAVAALRRRRPLEHRLLGLSLKPWSPVDSILVSKGMALGLSFKWRAAPVFGALAGRLGGDPALLRALLPTLPAEEALAVTRLAATPGGGLPPFLPFAPAVGSNAWVVGAGRSRSGKPLLACDPHLELSLPPIWFLVSLSGARYAAVGGSIPGLPGVVVGRTPTVAWGLTNGMIDDADLWVERLDGAGRTYAVDGRRRPLRVVTHQIRRRGAAPQLFRVRHTHRGPLVSDAWPDGAGTALSLRMTLHEPSGDLETFLGLGRARGVDEALCATRGFGSPAQNLFLADTTGRAAYRLMGTVPRRALTAHPAFPRDGADGRSDWHAPVPWEQLPQAEVGPLDQAVSANHPQVGRAYPHYLSHLYEPDYRALRIGEGLAGRRDLTPEDMAALQRDAFNPAVALYRARVFGPLAPEVLKARPALGPALQRLLALDGGERASDRGPPLWHLTYHHLIRRTFEPRLGPALTAQWMGLINLVDTPLLVAFTDPQSPWAPPGVRATLLGEALEDAVADLKARGLSLDAPWGALHTLTLRHPAGSLAATAPTFNRGPYPMDGGPFCVASGQYLHPRPGPMLVGASYRQVVDLADPEASGRMITFGGQDGDPASPHYDDLTDRWRRGGWLPMRLLEEPARGVDLTLEPA